MAETQNVAQYYSNKSSSANISFLLQTNADMLKISQHNITDMLYINMLLTATVHVNWKTAQVLRKDTIILL